MFICPGCGIEVDECEDFIMCDECFEEAQAIRVIRDELAGLEEGDEDDDL